MCRGLAIVVSWLFRLVCSMLSVNFTILTRRMSRAKEVYRVITYHVANFKVAYRQDKQTHSDFRWLSACIQRTKKTTKNSDTKDLERFSVLFLMLLNFCFIIVTILASL